MALSNLYEDVLSYVPAVSCGAWTANIDTLFARQTRTNALIERTLQGVVSLPNAVVPCLQKPWDSDR